MKQALLITTLALGLVAPSLMRAHDPSKHKGKAVTGEIVSIAEDRFELKTNAGTVPVTFSSTTKFEHGNDVVDKTHLTKGDRVSVFGTKLPTGELVAKEVLLGISAGDHSKMKMKPGAESKKE